MSLPPIPSPPTDNLYKFMALSGVVLLIVAPFFWTTYYLKQEERFHATMRTMIEASPPAEYFFAKVQMEHGGSISPERRQLVEHYDAAKKEADRVSDEFLTTEPFKRIVATLAFALAALGLVLTGLGFPLWYVRVQRPIDRALLQESKVGNERAEQDARANESHCHDPC